MEWEQPYSPTMSSPSASNGVGLRRRPHPIQTSTPYTSSIQASPSPANSSSKKIRKSFQKLDMFPKIEQDLTIQSESNACTAILSYLLLFIIIFAEIYNHRSINKELVQHMTVDKSLNKKMRVDMNITFPALHCDDLHLDIMDVAGDAHNDVHDTMEKTRLYLDGGSLSVDDIQFSVNKAHMKEVDQLAAIDKSLVPGYCGPCYGAQIDEGQCCKHCDDVVDAYRKKGWNADGVKELSEQCVREGKTKPKLLGSGEGCRIAGYMEFGRVNGNFHVAIGEGVERNGQHIHTFLPDEVSKFNVSHVIHTLRFGPAYDEVNPKSKNSMEQTSLDGVTKIVTKDNGVSGMFQYFIKIVPTIYKGRKIVQEMEPNFDMSKEPVLETNRYFVTETYTPLMDVDEEDWQLGEEFETDDAVNYAASKVGGKTGLGHDKHENHLKQRAVLSGVFFVYQVYPFALELSKKEVPLTHLLIRIMATVGGLFTIAGWFEAAVCSTKKRKQRGLFK